jgi:hypothetical protein
MYGPRRSGAPIKRIVLYPGDRLFNESKIVVEPPQFAAAITISAAMKAPAILVAYWVEVIGLAPVDGSATVSNSLDVCLRPCCFLDRTTLILVQ